MSNAWSNRRSAPGRPQVCATKQPPPPPEGALTCSFTPQLIAMTEFESNCSDFHAANPDCGAFDEFTLSILGSNPNFTGPTTMTNNGLAEFCYSASDGPGDFVFAVEVTDCNGNKCITSVEFQVAPFGGPPP